ncbi:MAG: A/G-specific adenine glycosylase [Alphaproteobacteria bacterium RIFCSPHIGHO2_12_FULL_63_12]|nr:MAG: A/G-specific adenine glycosylase [Alphaproteobacteria bacterium RIFCSPHIGHO2_12_FULL_63_12]
MSAISRALLNWYDANARQLPWRIGPAARADGEAPDPYRVWLSEIMLQQTTVATVRPRYQRFLARWPSVEAMAAAPLDDILGEWAGLGYYARARNLHKCAVAVAARGGFPDNEADLSALPGIGPYTAAAIAAIAFDARAIVVDGNVERVAARLFAIDTPLPKAKAELKEAIAAVWPKKRSGDFAQALMDLGAGVCTPRNPKCGACPLSAPCCARAAGIAEELPRKLRKSDKPTRRGVAYALFNAKGEILFERRPDKGLLGGMLGLPCTEWSVEVRAPSRKGGGVIARRDWRHAGTVRHSFTHFHLELDVMTATAAKSFRPAGDQRWIAPDAARLPTVMKKATIAAIANGGETPSELLDRKERR